MTRHPASAPATRITCTATALSKAADAIVARARETRLSKNAVLNALAAAIAGPGHDWGLIKNAPDGVYTQPGLRGPDAAPSPEPPRAPTTVWLLQMDERDDWARPPMLFADKASALAHLAADTTWLTPDYTLEEVLDSLDQTGEAFLYADRDPDSEMPFGFSLTEMAMPAPAGDTPGAAHGGASDGDTPAEDCPVQAKRDQLPPLAVRWVLISEDILSDGYENFIGFETRAELDAWYATWRGAKAAARPEDDPCVDVLPVEMVEVTADFLAQTWVGDIAMAVDPQGETTWTVSPEMLAPGWTGPSHRDHISRDPFAPDWVRDWGGPFEVEVRAAPRES